MPPRQINAKKSSQQGGMVQEKRRRKGVEYEGRMEETRWREERGEKRIG
jgi:hypothetical protein